MEKINLLTKLVLALILTITSMLILNTSAIAYSTSDINATSDMPKMTSPIDNPEAYSPETVSSPVTTKLIGTVIRWIRNLGVIVGVLVVTIIGVKYMLAGAAEEKAQYKETLVPVVIGVIMLLGALTLISAVASMFD